MNLTPIQKSAVFTALQKAIKPESDQARHDANESLRHLYEETGTDRVRVSIGGTEVGTFSLAFEKDGFTVTDREAFDEFCLANGFAEERIYVKPAWKPKAAELMAESCPEGVERRVELKKDYEKLFRHVDGVYVVEGTNEVVPGISPKPKAIKATQMRGCKPEDVIPALRGLGVGVEQLLLGGE